VLAIDYGYRQNVEYSDGFQLHQTGVVK